MTAQAGDTPFQQQRAQVRNAARQRRKQIPERLRARAAERAAEHAERLLRLRGARSVALTIPVGSELDTWPLMMRLQRRGVAIFLPCLSAAGDMLLRRWNGGILRAGRYGIPAPVWGARAHRIALDIVFLPLLAADAHGNRLGSGGGYYDRWLDPVRHRRQPLRVGLGFAQQLFPVLPSMPWDVPLHRVVTDAGIVRCHPPQEEQD